MPLDASSFSIEKALASAIKAEYEAEEVYKKLSEMVNNFVMKDKLVFLMNEEKKHQKMLEKLFVKMFPDKDANKTDRSLVPKLSLVLEEDTSVLELLEAALEAEKASEEFYDELAEEVEDRGVQDMLRYLASMEHGHYFLLKGEYDLCEKDEAYFDREDFQYDMVHVGP